jgi:queuine tRNA-ribosyltransferase
MSFSIIASDPSGKARAGILKTPHGDVQTPVFMPVATQASVKALSQEDLDLLGVRAILANSYHLYLRPGTKIVAEAGGLHRFMGYDGMILTDSGGFQIMSLSELRKLDDEGVVFRSHIDGSEHRLTPEKVIAIQAELGSDCWTTLDECPPYPATIDQARSALDRSIRWAESSVPELNRQRESGKKALFFPILQGGLFPELRARAAEWMSGFPADGIALGGFSVGEPKPLTWEIVDKTCGALPKEKPRYLMGVGTPEDLWDAVACGVDMLDCVFPTRGARNGLVMTRTGSFNVGQSPQRQNFSKLDESCSCFVCARYSRAYLAHLFRSKELSAYRLLTYHNLHLMIQMMAEIRRSIIAGNFADSHRKFLDERN